MGRVWYTYIAKFLYIENNYKICGTGCSRFQEERGMNNGYCSGTISKCSNAGDYADIVVAKVVDNNSRLYSGYSVADTWYGEDRGRGIPELVNPSPSLI